MYGNLRNAPHNFRFHEISGKLVSLNMNELKPANDPVKHSCNDIIVPFQFRKMDGFTLVCVPKDTIMLIGGYAGNINMHYSVSHNYVNR